MKLCNFYKLINVQKKRKLCIAKVVATVAITSVLQMDTILIYKRDQSTVVSSNIKEFPSEIQLHSGFLFVTP